MSVESRNTESSTPAECYVYRCMISSTIVIALGVSRFGRLREIRKNGLLSLREM